MMNSILKWLLVMFVCGSCETAFCQPKNIYKAAFHYIKSINQGKDLIASDTLLKAELSQFTDELSAYWSKNKLKTELLLDSIDLRNKKNEKIRYGFLTSLGAKGAKPTQLVFFSGVTNNMITAEIMQKKANANLGHYSQSMFNRSTIYLFIWDSNNKIKKVFEHKNIQYE